LSAARVELRVDDLNERSWRVAQRLGFQLEGLLRSDTRDANGRLRDTRVYGAVALQDLRSS
jgi:RimJ/RimL family protein N-acetyltransferase